MKKITQLLMSFTLAFGLFSCTMVKQPQSSNFQRVKYNSHLNLAKKQDNQKLNATVNSFKDVNTVKEASTEIKIAKTNKEYRSNLTASTVKQEVNKTNKIDLNKAQEKVDLDGDNLQLTFNKIQNREVKPTSNFIAEPMPTAAARGDLGSLLYIILVVILALIIIGFVSNLAGGLLGLLIAILVILLILRLLGLA